ncbi:AhpC/TSA family protein [Chitinophaga agrisoli]|uniref:AhpC/TSA family protein n=1 Tax=Chitinophaga agrisoli TaxID=2607653 RepID=A0A5B2VJ46_9BACT|nr:TlpA disulfide reductase family protein [Chitinophaga agrisoli]KAA2238965.1 AhpC/TSA family protein [Chitinophaga agrisoli]
MKLISSLFVSLLFATGAYAQGKYTITGQLTGIPDSTIISLLRNDGNVLTTVSSDTIKNGAFSFTGSTDETALFMIMGNSEEFPSVWLDVWVAPGAVIKISGHNKLVKTWQVESPVKEQQEVTHYTAATAAYLDQWQQLTIVRKQLFREILKDNISPERKKQLKAAIDSVDAKSSAVSTQIETREIAIMQQTAVSTIWLKKLKNVAIDAKYGDKPALREQAIILYKRLNKQQRASVTGQEVYVLLYPPVVVKKGEALADADFKDLQGKLHHLADYKGKYLLLDFWSDGCGPCIMAMPELKQLSDSLKDQLTVISLNVDTKKQVWKAGSEREAITWINLSDGKGMAGIAARYGINGIPHYVMISPEGKILDTWVGYEKGSLLAKVQAHTKR